MSSVVKISAKIFVGKEVSAYPASLVNSVSGHSVIVVPCTNVTELMWPPHRYTSPCGHLTLFLQTLLPSPITRMKGMHLLCVAIEQSRANCMRPLCSALVLLILPALPVGLQMPHSISSLGLHSRTPGIRVLICCKWLLVPCQPPAFLILQ